MIGYVTLGTNDLDRARDFYESLFKVIKAQSFAPNDRMMMWTTKPQGAPLLGVCKPYDGKLATVGNGVMVALRVEEQDTVNTMHARALELGAENEGDPGPRAPGSGFYGGYFRDMDGNKLVVYCIGGDA